MENQQAVQEKRSYQAKHIKKNGSVVYYTKYYTVKNKPRGRPRKIKTKFIKMMSNLPDNKINQIYELYIRIKDLPDEKINSLCNIFN